MVLDFVFVLDHTIFNDIYRNYEEGLKNSQKYARFLQDYVIIRKAMIGCEELSITSREVFNRIVSRTIINPKDTTLPNIWIALTDMIGISNLTYSNSQILYKESVVLLATDISFKSPSKEVILLSNSEKRAIERVLTLYANYGRPLRSMDEAPFQIMDCEKAFKYLKEKDGQLFKDICEMLKGNYDFLKEE